MWCWWMWAAWIPMAGAQEEPLDEVLDEVEEEVQEVAEVVEEAVDSEPDPAPVSEAGSGSGGPFQDGPGRNMWGGRSLNKGERQVLLGTGFPDSEVGVRFGLGQVDAMPLMRFTYGGGVRLGTGMVSVGAGGRFQVFSSGAVDGSLVAELPVHFAFFPGAQPVVGLGILHPGFLVTVDVQGWFDVNVGVRVVDDLFFTPGAASFRLAVPLVAGVEAQVVDRFQIGMRMEGGPGMAFGTQGTVTVSPEVRVQVSAGYAF